MCYCNRHGLAELSYLAPLYFKNVIDLISSARELIPSSRVTYCF